jgi:O-antigen ligase
MFNAAVLDEKLSLFKSITMGGNYFFYQHLSVFMHPAYFSMYISLSFIIIFYLAKNGCFENNKAEKVLFYSISLFFLGFIYLLFSKAGIFVVIFILICFFIYFLKQKANILMKILFFIFVALFIVVNFKYNDRMNILIKEYRATEFELKNYKLTSDDDRLNIWLSSFDVIKNNFLFGVGNGDVEDELKIVYEKHNMRAAIDKSLNAHNQFLETFLALGFIGFSIIVAILIIPLINAIKKRNILLLAFVVIIVFNFIFESMLNTQAGVVFFAFFFSFLNFVNNDESGETIYQNAS